MAYDPVLKHKKTATGIDSNSGSAHNMETPLEKDVSSMKAPLYLELSIHIYQSIDFLQELTIPLDQVREKQIEVEWKKPHINKLLLLDLDETLAHCVKKPHPDRKPHVFLNLTTPSGG